MRTHGISIMRRMHSIFEELPTDLVWAQILPLLPAADFDLLFEQAWNTKDLHFIHRLLMPAHEERRKRGLPVTTQLVCYILRSKPIAYIKQLYHPKDLDLSLIQYWYSILEKKCLKTWQFFTNRSYISLNTLYHLAIEHEYVEMIEMIDIDIDDWTLEHLLTAIYKKKLQMVEYMMQCLHAYIECQDIIKKGWNRVYLGDTTSMQERYAILRISLHIKEGDRWTLKMLKLLNDMLGIHEVIFYSPFLV